MFSIRVLGGIALLLAGSSWLWLTPEFVSAGLPRSGPVWSITRILCLVTVVGFCVATWGLFRRAGWWEPVALASAALGLVTLVPFWIAAQASGETMGTIAWNVFIHVLMVAGVFVLLLVPPLERWVAGHVMGH